MTLEAQLCLFVLLFCVVLSIKFMHKYWVYEESRKYIYISLIFDFIGGIYGGYVLLDFTIPELQTVSMLIFESGCCFVAIGLISLAIGTLWWKILKW